MELIKYIGKRLLTLVPVLLGISFCAFILGILAPGDPAEQALFSIGIELPTEIQMEEMREELGLNDPIHEQYLRWLGNAIHADFGESYFTSVKVADEFARRIPVTLKIAFLAMIWTSIMSVFMGICMAIWRNKLFDKVLRTISVIMLSVPGFWLAMLLIMLFSEQLRWLPTSGNGGLAHMIMPTFTLTCATIGTVARITRASLLTELGEQYILVAKAKGLANRLVVLRHASANALVPIVTLMGNYFGGILGGATIIESIFALNGMGSYVLSAIKSNDYPIVQAYVLYTGCIYVVVTLFIDLLYVAVNPKIRLGGGSGK